MDVGIYYLKDRIFKRKKIRNRIIFINFFFRQRPFPKCHYASKVLLNLATILDGVVQPLNIDAERNGDEQVIFYFCSEGKKKEENVIFSFMFWFAVL